MKLTHDCSCQACSHSCNYGSGAFTNKQLPIVAEFLGIAVEELKEKHLEKITKFNTELFRPKILRGKKPYGKCTFYDRKKGCTIHPVKPLECKLAMDCKDYGEDLILWFVQNHFVNEKDQQSIKEFEDYLKAGGKKLSA